MNRPKKETDYPSPRNEVLICIADLLINSDDKYVRLIKELSEKLACLCVDMEEADNLLNIAERFISEKQLDVEYVAWCGPNQFERDCIEGGVRMQCLKSIRTRTGMSLRDTEGVADVWFGAATCDEGISK